MIVQFSPYSDLELIRFSCRCPAVEGWKENIYVLPYTGFGILLVLFLWKDFYLICSPASAASYSHSLWIWYFSIRYVSIANYIPWFFHPSSLGQFVVVPRFYSSIDSIWNVSQFHGPLWTSFTFCFPVSMFDAKFFWLRYSFH